MHSDMIQNCVRYFEGRVGHEIRKAHKYDKIEVNDYGQYLIEKSERNRAEQKKKQKEINAYVDKLLTKPKKKSLNNKHS